MSNPSRPTGTWPSNWSASPRRPPWRPADGSAGATRTTPTEPRSTRCAADLGSVGMRGTVVIGEGEKDNAPMLFNGEEVGDGTGPECDVAVDPIDGTTLTAKGMNNAIAVMAVAPRRHDVRPLGRVLHGEAGHRARGRRRRRHPQPGRREHPRGRQGQGHARADDVTVVLLDRPRHAGLVEEIRATGARIKYIPDGDVAGAIMAARPDTGVDLLLGIGGTPEGIIAACAMKCTRRRDPGPAVAQGRRGASAGPRRRPRPRPRHILTTDDLVTSEDCFFVATGITDGELMKGVRFRSPAARSPTRW